MRLSRFALVIVMTACERQPTPIELLDDQLVLHSMLVAGDNIAAVLLTRARSTNGVYDEQISDPATGARVMLSYGTTTLMLLPQSDTLNRCVTYQSQIDFFGRGEDPQKDAYLRPGCYVARVPGRIQGGMGYTLHATIAGEGAITGTTMVPSQPLIRTPGYDAILPVHSPQANVPHLPVAWSMSANTSHSTVGLLLNRQECRATLMATEVELSLQLLAGVHSDSGDRPRFSQYCCASSRLWYDRHGQSL